MTMTRDLGHTGQVGVAEAEKLAATAQRGQ
jgi:hypothetical protein